MDGVTVIAVGSLKKRLPERATVAPAQTVAQVLESLQLGTSETILPIVNGQIVSLDHVLEPGDALLLVQDVVGGTSNRELS